MKKSLVVTLSLALAACGGGGGSDSGSSSSSDNSAAVTDRAPVAYEQKFASVTGTKWQGSVGICLPDIGGEDPYIETENLLVFSDGSATDDQIINLATNIEAILPTLFSQSGISKEQYLSFKQIYSRSGRQQAIQHLKGNFEAIAVDRSEHVTDIMTDLLDPRPDEWDGWIEDAPDALLGAVDYSENRRIWLFNQLVKKTPSEVKAIVEETNNRMLTIADGTPASEFVFELGEFEEIQELHSKIQVCATTRLSGFQAGTGILEGIYVSTEVSDDILMHELIHHMQEQFVVGYSSSMPRWFTEGQSVYLSGQAIDRAFDAALSIDEIYGFFDDLPAEYEGDGYSQYGLGYKKLAEHSTAEDMISVMRASGEFPYITQELLHYDFYNSATLSLDIWNIRARKSFEDAVVKYLKNKDGNNYANYQEVRDLFKSN